MELYGSTERSIPQKAVIIALELIFLWIAYQILFNSATVPIIGSRLSGLSDPNRARRELLFAFSIVVFLRLTFMMLYVGYPLFAADTSRPLDSIDALGVVVFVVGSFTNTYSELRRHFWKKKDSNRGRLYTGGPFSLSMHVNYFGDVLWVSAYAIVTRNIFSLSIPIFLLCFFVFYNIPKLDAYLAQKYGDEFATYAGRTKKLIPFIY
jgi:protein-S-isoprenylcysteine O-methyltransferase Ste14